MIINIVDSNDENYKEYGQLVLEVPVPEIQKTSDACISKLSSVFCGYTECLYKVDDEKLCKLLKAWAEIPEYSDCSFVLSAKKFNTDEFGYGDKCMEISICRNGTVIKEIAIAEANALYVCTIMPI